ncbi:hypothetical protein F2Q69_00002985 [Brassica cretica]|uniref:Uncharacterized protein n=1 Tax=Brassica cretica TaxID=69181 RepID=A0A8S9NTQ5_BRACR|nr:hypothetical protein F2Q69_00002985 [Brassica cretica]
MACTTSHAGPYAPTLAEPPFEVSGGPLAAGSPYPPVCSGLLAGEAFYSDNSARPAMVMMLLVADEASVPQGEVYPHEEKESFHCRVDRHGTPFGNRVSSDNSRVQPLKNKITPGNPSLSPLARTQDAHHAVAHGRGSVPNRYKPPNPPQL